jgi:hypothetical protein
MKSVTLSIVCCLSVVPLLLILNYNYQLQLRLLAVSTVYITELINLPNAFILKVFNDFITGAFLESGGRGAVFFFGRTVHWFIFLLVFDEVDFRFRRLRWFR